MEGKKIIRKEAHKRQLGKAPKPMPDIHAYVLSAIVVVFLVVMAVNLSQTFSISKALQPKEALQFSVKIISDINCKDCTDLTPLAKGLEKYGKVDSVSLDKSSQEAQDLIKKYGITALPNAVITGDIDKEPKLKTDLASLGAVENDGALVLTKIPPPYYDVKTAKVKGLVNVILLQDSTCKQCADLNDLVTQLKDIISVAGDRTVDASSDEGRSLIAKYQIKSLPTIILSQDASLYPAIGQAWPSLGTVESDGSLVMRQVPPPYKDVASNTVKGLVSLTYLVDKSCTTCYNVSVHKQALASLGISSFDKETYIDVSSAEGKALVSKYSIGAVPTIVMIGDLVPYTQLHQVWSSVGSVESDGSYVFRNMAAIKGAVYKNLTSGTVTG